MNLSKKKIVFLTLGLLCLLIALFGTGIGYISKLPGISGSNDMPKTIQRQISNAKISVYIWPSSDNLGKLGMIFHSGAHYREAAQCYRLAIKKNSKNEIWNYYLGFLNLEEGAVKEALDNFRKVIKLDPGNFMAVYYSGESCHRLNDFNEAEKYFNSVLSFDDRILNAGKPKRENYFPVKIYAKFNLARIYLDNERLEETEKLLKEIINEQVTFGPAYRLLGNVWSKRGDQSLSKKYTVRAKDYNDYMPPIDPLIDELLLISRSELTLLKGIDMAINNRNFQWAVKLCDHSIRYLPDNKFLLSKAIKVYMTAGMEPRAFGLIEKHIFSYKEDFRELMEMADFFMTKERSKMGVLYFSAAKKLEPRNPILPVWLMKWNFGKGAQTLMKEQLDKVPDNPKFLSNAINISIGSKDKEAAINYMDRLKKLSPLEPDIKRFSGYLAYQEYNYDEAISDWKDVIVTDLKDIALIRSLNKIYKQKEKWSESSMLLHKALQDNPNDPQLLDEYGKLLVVCPDEKIRNIDEGREYSERAYYSFFTNFEVRLSSARNLTTAYAILGNKKMATKFLNITSDLGNQVNTTEIKTWADDLKKKYSL